MNFRFHVGLGLIIGALLVTLDARGQSITDPLMDTMLDEYVTATKLEQDTSNVADIQFADEILLRNLQAYQKAHPLAYAKMTGDLISSLELRLEIVKWREEGVSKKNPNDPRGLEKVAVHLEDREHQAERMLNAGKPDDAERQFISCCNSWGWIQMAYPDWKPEKVRGEMNRINEGIMRIYIKTRKTPYRYVDPKLGTPLSV